MSVSGNRKVRFVYVKVNNDLICIDKLIKAELTPASYNKGTIKLTYLVNDITAKEPVVTSEFSHISPNSIQLLAEAVQNNKNFVDLSKNP